MSRIGKKPIPVPKGVDIKVAEGLVTVKGPKGQLTQHVDPLLDIQVNDGVLEVKRPNNDRRLRAQHGLVRTLLSNMVTGVTEGFTRSLQIIGVGYRCAAAGKGLELQLGFSHPVKIDPIEGIDFEVEVDNRAKINKIHIRGIDKQRVGQVAANLRGIRPPEPYKGKGIRYVNEVVAKKEGKAGKA
ncbi:MAG: 50S ribosomal protein L6 [Vulcanimicrobiota bacterium]